MKKEQLIKEITDVAIAVVPQVGETLEKEWNVFLINLKDKPLETVIVVMKGYGIIDQRGKETTTFRKIMGDVGPKEYIKIEPIMEELFQLENEYWVSFWCEGEMYDKRYIFQPFSIKEDNFTDVPLMDKKGVVLK